MVGVLIVIHKRMSLLLVDCEDVVARNQSESRIVAVHISLVLVRLICGVVGVRDVKVVDYEVVVVWFGGPLLLVCACAVIFVVFV